MNTLQDKIQGCLVGGAAGDALGYAVEFKSYKQIVAMYGSQGITRYELDRKGLAEISDDTQMTLFTANGLLIDDIQAAYLEWYETQTGGCAKQPNAKCWLSEVRELYSRRAPGMTCMSALESIKEGRPVHNTSKGCGGIMRVAPVGIYGAAHRWSLEKTAAVACEAARMTHQHPLGWISAGVFAAWVQQLILLNEESCRELMEDPNKLEEMAEMGEQAVREYIRAKGDGEDALSYLKEFKDGLRHALSMANKELPDEEAIRQIGEGWVGEEACYIAAYCLKKHLADSEKAIIAAVNHNGDSDSTGAVAGNLVGALHGYAALPDHFKQNLELRDVILKISDQLMA